MSRGSSKLWGYGFLAVLGLGLLGNFTTPEEPRPEPEPLAPVVQKAPPGEPDHQDFYAPAWTEEKREAAPAEPLPEPEAAAPAPPTDTAPPPAPAYAAPAESAPAVSQEVVHVTRTGEKYHTSGCRYLSRSDIPIPLDQALERGYDACSVCGGR